MSIPSPINRLTKVNATLYSANLFPATLENFFFGECVGIEVQETDGRWHISFVGNQKVYFQSADTLDEAAAIVATKVELSQCVLEKSLMKDLSFDMDEWELSYADKMVTLTSAKKENVVIEGNSKTPRWAAYDGQDEIGHSNNFAEVYAAAKKYLARSPSP